MIANQVLDNLPDSNQIIEREAKLDKKQIIKLFHELINSSYENFFATHIELKNSEKAILLHLNHIYNDSLKTVDVYCNSIVSFLNYVGQNISSINYYCFNDYLNFLKKNDLSLNTINNHIAILKSFFGFCHKTGILQYNPVATLKKVKGNGSKKTYRVLTLEEIKTLLDYARKNENVRDYLMLKTFYLTGLRGAELVNVKWGSFFRNVYGSWYASIFGKGSKVRDVYMPKELMDELMVMRQFYYGISPYENEGHFLQNMPVFTGQNSRMNKHMSVNNAYRIVQRIGMQALDKKISPHWLRHSFATHARMKKENGESATIESIKLQLGHASINTTMEYEHSAQLSEPAGKAMENILDKI